MPWVKMLHEFDEFCLHTIPNNEDVINVSDPKKRTGAANKACTWLRDIYFCSCLAWVLLSKICIPYLGTELEIKKSVTDWQGGSIKINQVKKHPFVHLHDGCVHNTLKVHSVSQKHVQDNFSLYPSWPMTSSSMACSAPCSLTGGRGHPTRFLI